MISTAQDRQKLILLVVVGLIYSFALAWFFQGLPNAKLTSDFFPRWHASRMLLTTGRSVYDWANAPEISAVTGWPKLHQLGYYYPAYMLLFTAPLALLPYSAAHVVWVMLGLWFMWLAMFTFAQTATLRMSLNQLTLLLVLVTTSIPVFQHTLYAQFNTIGLLALALSYRALARQNYFAAGMWAGGLLFKPQATLVSLAVLALWTALRRERWRFWWGLAAIGLLLWALPQILEPGWVLAFVGTLGSYEPIQSVIDILPGNPYHIISGALFAGTLGLVWLDRAAPAADVRFQALLAWSICLNALIVPMYGMLHMVLIGPVLIILLGNAAAFSTQAARWLWPGTALLFAAGLLAFTLPLLLTNSSGLQINAAEAVYRFTMPVVFGGAALYLFFAHTQATKGGPSST